MHGPRFDVLVARLGSVSSRRGFVGLALAAVAAPAGAAGAAQPGARCGQLQQLCSKKKPCCRAKRGDVRCAISFTTGHKTCCGQAKTSCQTSDVCCYTFGCDRALGQCVAGRPGGGSCVPDSVFDPALCCSRACTGGICNPACQTQADCPAGQQCCSLGTGRHAYPFGY
ncbi:MAG TPA: hypothetical protein VFU81_00005, partial [Thermomicrobiales bacterium]|nr:hypothetical protein [Thermomicrobiales bacterium]